MSEALPEGWAIKPLGELAQIISGGTPSRNVADFWEGGTIPWVTPTDITATHGKYISDSKDRITKLGLTSCSASLLPSGSILMTSRATLGEAKISRMPACTNQGFKSLVANPGVSNEFLYYQIQRTKQQYARFGSGSTFLEVGKKDTTAFPVMIPSETSQAKIAQLLSLIDTQIEATEGLIAKQERVRAGLMQDLFTRGVDEHGHLRPPRHQAPHLYHQTELGWLPVGWEAGSILRYCTVDRQPILTGPFGADLGSADFVDDGVPLLRIGNVQDRHLRLDDLLFVSERKAHQLAKYRITPNDLLFARQGATTGRNALANEKVDGALINYHIIRVSLDPKKCSPRFVESMFNSWLITHQIEQSKGRGTREGINTQQITSLLFPGPDIAEQIQITAVLNEAMAAIEAMKGELAKLALQKSGLMQDLLTGTVSVAPLLEALPA